MTAGKICVGLHLLLHKCSSRTKIVEIEKKCSETKRNIVDVVTRAICTLYNIKCVCYNIHFISEAISEAPQFRFCSSTSGAPRCIGKHNNSTHTQSDVSGGDDVSVFGCSMQHNQTEEADYIQNDGE